MWVGVGTAVAVREAVGVTICSVGEGEIVGVTDEVSVAAAIELVGDKAVELFISWVQPAKKEQKNTRIMKRVQNFFIG